MNRRIASAQHVISTFTFCLVATLSAVHGQALTKHVANAIWKDRNDLSHNPFWQHVMKRKSELENIGDPFRQEWGSIPIILSLVDMEMIITTLHLFQKICTTDFTTKH